MFETTNARPKFPKNDLRNLLKKQVLVGVILLFTFGWPAVDSAFLFA